MRKVIAALTVLALLGPAASQTIIPSGSGGGGAPSGAAGGGLAGSYPNPTVAAVPATALPALTGDVTSSAGSAATTVAKVNGNTPGGSCATQPVTSLSSSAVPTCGNIPVGAVTGVTTNSNATAGFIGEYTSSIVLGGSAVTLTSGAASNITSISLTAGDWDVSGVCATQPTGAVVTTVLICNITTTSATLNNAPSDAGAFAFNNSTQAAAGGQAMPTDVARASLASTTTYFLVTQATFSGGTSLGGYGKIRARRVH